MMFTQGGAPTCTTNPIRNKTTDKDESRFHKVFARLQNGVFGVVDVQLLYTVNTS